MNAIEPIFPAPEKYACPRCGKTYRSPETLGKHIREKPPKE